MLSRLHTGVKTNSIAGSRAFATLWFAYFLLTVAVIGLTTAYALSAPFYLLAYLVPRVLPFADRMLFLGTSTLLKVQPWLNAQVDLVLPSPNQKQNAGRLIVSNHRSHLDAFILLSQIPGLRLLAKQTLFYIPFLGFLMLISRQIPVPRGRLDVFFKAMERVRAALRAGQTVHVFPEMTRCAPGFHGTLNFSSAPFSVALQEGALVIPVVFKGTDATWAKGTYRLSYRQPIHVRTLEAVDTSEFETADQLRNEVRRRINEALK